LQAAGAIGHTVTKFSLVYSKTPNKEEGASICQALDKPCEQLLAAANVALFCGAGPSLAAEIITDAMCVCALHGYTGGRNTDVVVLPAVA
jgi:hypothetical protein